MRPRTAPRARSLAALAAGLLAALALALLPAPDAAAQWDDPTLWRTMASGDEISALAIDPSDPGRLWAGTEGGGVVIWELSAAADEVTGSFRQVLSPNEPGLRSNTVHDIAFDAATGDVWLATENGVTRAAGAQWSTELYEDGMPESPYFSAVAVAQDGTVWAGTPEYGLSRRNPNGGWEFFLAEDFVPDEDDVAKDGPGSNCVAALAVDLDDRLWVVHGRACPEPTERPAYSLYDPVDDAWYHITAGDSGSDPADGPRTENVLDVDVDPLTGEVWLATWSRGVSRYDPGADLWTEWDDEDPDTREETGLCSSNVWRVEAEDGRAWAACGSSDARTGEGAAHFDGFEWATLDVGNGLPRQEVTAIAMADDWVYLGHDSRTIGVEFAGIGVVPARNELPPVDGDALVSAPLSTAGDAPAANEITSLAFDIQGRLWAGTLREGVLVHDPADGSWERFTRDSTQAGLPGDTITDILLVGEEVWVATTETLYDSSSGGYLDGGVGIYDPFTDSWRDLPRPAPFGVEDGQIAALAELPDGRVAMGLGKASGEGLREDVNNGRGVAIYDPAIDDYTYEDFYATDGNLNGNTVPGLAHDGAELWAATSYFPDELNDVRRTGGGAARFDGSSWQSWGAGDEGFESYEDELITGDSRVAFVDREAQAWIGTWSLDSGQLTTIWPYVDAVANLWDGVGWIPQRFDGQGWVSSFAQDGEGVIWLGLTRGTDKSSDYFYESWPGSGVAGESSPKRDQASGGLRIWDGFDWLELDPSNSGLASGSVTALAVEPATGYLYVGTHSGGIAVYESGEPLGPTPTPRPTYTPGPSPTPGPTRTATTRPTATNPPFSTVPRPTATEHGGGPIQPRPTATRDGGGPVPEPEPPPEVPEASTWLMLAMGLAAVGAFWYWRRRQVLEG